MTFDEWYEGVKEPLSVVDEVEALRRAFEAGRTIGRAEGAEEIYSTVINRMRGPYLNK